MAKVSIDKSLLENLETAKRAYFQQQDAHKRAVATLQKMEQQKQDAEQKIRDAWESFNELLDKVPDELKTLVKFQDEGIDVTGDVLPIGNVNDNVAAELKKRLKGKDYISVSKKVKQEIANDCECSIEDVEATMDEILVSYNPEGKKGRNIRFALK